MKNRIISIIIIVLVVVGAGSLLMRSHNKINAKKAGVSLSSEIVVSVAEVGTTSTGSTLNLTGTLTPFTEVVVAAQAAGQITSLNVELGQQKSKGSVLATIDNRLKTLAVESAQLNFDKQKKDLARYESLYQGGTVTAQQMDDARMGFASAQIQLEQAKKQLDDATVTAPISGIITDKNAEKGSFTSIGSPIAKMVDISRLKIRMNVSESNVYKLQVGDAATVTSDVAPDKTFNGKITFISSKGDDSHNYAVEVVISNSGKLKAGTFANVVINIPGKASALCIPREALLGSSQDAKVYVVENGKASTRKITVGGGNEQMLFILEGLAKGEQVVTAGQINLIDGQSVKIAANK
jgi:membrane fusion protein, multidrug efflux system